MLFITTNDMGQYLQFITYHPKTIDGSYLVPVVKDYLQ